MTDSPKQPSEADEIGQLKKELDAAKKEILRLKQELCEYPEQLEQMVQERTRELEVINQIADTVSRSLNLDVIIRESLDKVLELLGLDVGAVYLTDEQEAQLNLMVSYGLPDNVAGDMSSMSIGKGCPGLVALKGEPVLIQDYDEVEHTCGGFGLHPDFKSLAGVPLESKGRVWGVLCIFSKEKGRFTKNDLSLLVTIGSEIGVAIENAWLYEKSYNHSKKMEELSITDSLTRLFNRRQLYRRLKEEMARAKRQLHPLSLLIVDLDNLKSYNDLHGHLKGDEALREIARAISASIRQDVDTGYRYGGDEFAVILPYSDISEAKVIAERIRKTYEDFALPNATLSIGLAQLQNEDEVDDLVSRADTAMYVAKNLGGNRVHES